MTFTANKKQSKLVRLVGTLTIDVNGHSIDVSNTFKLQTDLQYSGMTLAEQDTVMKAIATSLKGIADVRFSATLVAEEPVTKGAKTPSKLDQILAELDKPNPEEMLDAETRDDQAKQDSIEKSLDILGIKELPKSRSNV